MEWLILALIAALVILGVAAREQWGRRTYEQTWAMPTFTDSMPRQQAETERLERLVGDAKWLLHRQYRGATASRRVMQAQGMSERRWRDTVRLLRSLGIYARSGMEPRISEYHATRRLDKWLRIQSGRVGENPWYVSNQ